MGMAIITIGILVIRISERNMIDMKMANGTATLTLFRTLIEERHRTDGNPGADLLQNRLKDFSSGSKAIEVVLFDKDRKIIASTEPTDSEKFDSDSIFDECIEQRRVTAYAEKSGTALLFRRYKNVSVCLPLSFGGAVRAVFPLDDMNNLLQRTTWLMLFFLSFDLLLLFLFGSYLLNRRIVSPIRRFADAAENIAEGDLNQRVAYEGENEIGQLANSFNTMADNLGDHVGYLQRANRELRHARQELIRSEKLASVGRLAAGVAHEVGNPLGAILGYLDLLLKGMNDEAERNDFLARIEKEIKKIDLTIRELLDYSRASRVEVKEVDVNEVIREAMSLVSHQKDFANFRVELALDKGVAKVMADANQLQQVIVNLALNAFDAMPEGGCLTIETSEERGDVPAPEVPRRRRGDQATGEFRVGRMEGGERDDRRVIITIADTGEGIKDEDLEKIFDPFYTTKDPGKGTGLGLSISQGIIEAFRGTITVKSKQGVGTTFTVSLPAEKKDDAVNN